MGDMVKAPPTQNMEMTMQLYRVTIDFKKGPAFSTEVHAASEASAASTALTLARGCGFDAAVKKTKVVEMAGAA